MLIRQFTEMTKTFITHKVMIGKIVVIKTKHFGFKLMFKITTKHSAQEEAPKT